MKKSLLATFAAAALFASSSAAQSHPAMLIGYSSLDAIDNFQEKAAADFFVKENPNGVILTPSDAGRINSGDISYIWIHIDRLNIGKGNLPEAFTSPEMISALTRFHEDGGSLLLTKQATQLLSSIGRIDAKFDPNIYGDGDGGQGTDVWTIQPQVGFWFAREDRMEAEDYNPDACYDHRGHPIYKNLRVYPWADGAVSWDTYPMEGTGDGTGMHREDHNCMWDLNALSYSVDGANTVVKFETEANCVVLGQWGHVQDYAVAGIVEFLPTASAARSASAKGTVIANGLAACEWSPRSGVNAYHDNLEQLTRNCFSYLDSKSISGVADVDVTDNEASVEYYNLQGVLVHGELTPGFYIRRQGKEVSKVAVR